MNPGATVTVHSRGFPALSGQPGQLIARFNRHSHPGAPQSVCWHVRVGERVVLLHPGEFTVR